MSNVQLTETEIQAAEQFVLDELKKDYTRRDPKALNMPGVETVLIIIVNKIIIPVVVSIAGKLGYDKVDEWRKGKLKKEEIIKQATSFPADGHMDRTKVVADIVADLKNDGVPEAKARELVEKTFEKLQPDSVIQNQ